AHGGVPGRLDHATVVRGDAVVLAVVDQDVGIRNAGHGTVEVMDRRRPVRHATAVVVVEAGIDVREVHRLGIDEGRTTYRAFSGNAGAGEQQPGECARLAQRIVLVVHEGHVDYVIAVVIVLVAADREIRKLRLRQ